MKIIGLVGNSKNKAFRALKEASIVHDQKLNITGPAIAVLSKVLQIATISFHDATLRAKPLDEPLVLTGRLLKQIRRECEAELDAMRADGTMMYRPMVASISGIENQTVTSIDQLIQIITEELTPRIHPEWNIQAATQQMVLDQLSENGIYAITDISKMSEVEFLKNKFGDSFECYYVASESEELTAELQAIKDISTVMVGKDAEDKLLSALKGVKLKEGTDVKPKKKTGLKFVDKNGKSTIS